MLYVPTFSISVDPNKSGLEFHPAILSCPFYDNFFLWDMQ